MIRTWLMLGIWIRKMLRLECTVYNVWNFGCSEHSSVPLLMIQMCELRAQPRVLSTVLVYIVDSAIASHAVCIGRSDQERGVKRANRKQIYVNAFPMFLQIDFVCFRWYKISDDDTDDFFSAPVRFVSLRFYCTITVVDGIALRMLSGN